MTEQIEDDTWDDIDYSTTTEYVNDFADSQISDEVLLEQGGCQELYRVINFDGDLLQLRHKICFPIVRTIHREAYKRSLLGHYRTVEL